MSRLINLPNFIQNISKLIKNSNGNLYVKKFGFEQMNSIKYNLMNKFKGYNGLVSKLFPKATINTKNKPLNELFKGYNELTPIGKYYIDNKLLVPSLIDSLIKEKYMNKSKGLNLNQLKNVNVKVM